MASPSRSKARLRGSARETAEGSSVKRELEKLAAQPGDAPIITSGCSTIVLCVEKHLPEALPYLAPVFADAGTCRAAAQALSGATIVYVSPCISKKEETTRFESVGADYDITFTELEDWMHEAGVAVNPNVPADEPLLSRGYTITNGVLHSMSLDSGRDYLFLDGLDDSIQTLKSVVNGELRNCFIEIAACHGNCVGGLAFRQKHTNLLESRRRVIKSAGGKKNFDIQEPVDMRRVLVDKKHPTDLPPESVINGILRKMGKFSPADELNCGLCGYRTCRDKAIAVYEGRAEISMCMPYMKERAETYSEKIINVSPEGIVTVGKKLKVKQINKAACKIFGIKDPADIIGYPVSRIMDEYDFVKMISQDETQVTDEVFLADYNVYLERIFICDPERTLFTCIMRDVTKARQRRNKIQKTKIHAADLADDIIANQLRIVHEIASLLGETAAETKVAKVGRSEGGSFHHAFDEDGDDDA